MMVVIDYLQILAPRDTALRASDKQIVDDNVRELCKIRDQQNVIILLISALNRISYNRAITMESFKESGSIEYSADVILGMQYQGIEGKKFSLESAKAQSPRNLELTLLKMRYGQDGIRIPSIFTVRAPASSSRTAPGKRPVPPAGAAGAISHLSRSISRRLSSEGPPGKGVTPWRKKTAGGRLTAFS